MKHPHYKQKNYVSDKQKQNKRLCRQGVALGDFLCFSGLRDGL
jgi:hypothetical protein